MAPLVADAFAQTYWWAFALIALAAIPALFLPRMKPALPQPQEQRVDEAVAVAIEV